MNTIITKVKKKMTNEKKLQHMLNKFTVFNM